MVPSPQQQEATTTISETILTSGNDVQTPVNPRRSFLEYMVPVTVDSETLLKSLLLVAIKIFIFINALLLAHKAFYDACIFTVISLALTISAILFNRKQYSAMILLLVSTTVAVVVFTLMWPTTSA